MGYFLYLIWSLNVVYGKSNFCLKDGKSNINNDKTEFFENQPLNANNNEKYLGTFGFNRIFFWFPYSLRFKILMYGIFRAVFEIFLYRHLNRPTVFFI